MNRLNWKYLTGVAAVLIAGVAFLSVTGGTVAAQTTTIGPTNSISVSGFGEVTGTPDVAYVQLGVDVANADISAAVDQANTDVAAVIAALTDAGIAPEDIQTTNFNVYPEDRYDPQTGQSTGERTYRVQNTVQITVRDISKIGEVVQAGLNAGADTVYGLNFGIEDTTALEAEARLKAVEDARARATALAEAFGVTVGEPIVITEVVGGGFIPVAFDRAQSAVGGAGGPSIQPGQLSVSVQITVSFALGE